jgi:hypothetical protein
LFGNADDNRKDRSSTYKTHNEIEEESKEEESKVEETKIGISINDISTDQIINKKKAIEEDIQE